MYFIDDTTKVLLEKRQLLKEEQTRSQNYAKTLKNIFLGDSTTIKELPSPSIELPTELRASISSVSETASRVNNGIKQVSLNENIIREHQGEIEQLEGKIKNFYIGITIAIVVVLILFWTLLS